jgi:lipoprotein-anchoring transpeptidase ErfK/SrfK
LLAILVLLVLSSAALFYWEQQKRQKQGRWLSSPLGTDPHVRRMIRVDGTNNNGTSSMASNPSALADVRILRRSTNTLRLESESRSDSFPRPIQNVLEAQIAMARLGISSGSLDGRFGPQTSSALRAFQQKAGLPVTGELDIATKEKLPLCAPPWLSYTVTSNDLARLQPLSPTWLGKSQQSALEYETILEMLAEKSESHPALLRKINPGINWSNVPAGISVRIPDTTGPEAPSKAAFVVIHLADRVLEAFDSQTNLLAHFPCSIAQRFDKRPIGELHVDSIAPNPNYTFDPDVFPESAEARELKTKLVLPPGPNNPVGVAWLGLDKPGYGIHGTPNPEQVGRTESHGCFRLANWNAEYLVHLVTIGMPVRVEP